MWEEWFEHKKDIIFKTKSVEKESLVEEWDNCSR